MRKATISDMPSIAIIELKESYLSAVHGIKEILGDAESRKPGTFEVEIVGASAFVRKRRHYDLVIVPPIRLRTENLPGGQPRALPGKFLDLNLVASLKRSASRGSLLCSVCAGAFYLCATGIADGEPVTTHWRLAGVLQEMFPRVAVQKEKILIERSRFITAGGVTSYQDLCLHLIRRYADVDSALATAGTFLLNPEDRTQLQYVSLSLNVGNGNEDVAKAVAFIKSSFAKPIGLEEIASHCGITVRTLLRRFHEHGGCTPGAYLQTVRLAYAKTLLQSGHSTVKSAALESGYRDIVSFSRAFRKLTGLNPGEYSRRNRAGK